MPDNESSMPSPSRYFYISSFKDNEITLSVHEKDPIANGATLHLKTEDKNGKIVRSNIDLSSVMDKVDNKLANFSSPELSSSLTVLDYVNSSSNVVGIPDTAKMCYIDITKNTEFEFPYLEINTFKKFELIINNPNNTYTLTFPETVTLINSSMGTNISNNELLKFTGINANGVNKWYMSV